jgi:hypothetical protein
MASIRDLWTAIYSKQHHLAQAILMDRSIDLNAKNKKDFSYTALHFAVFASDLVLVE